MDPKPVDFLYKLCSPSLTLQEMERYTRGAQYDLHVSHVTLCQDILSSGHCDEGPRSKQCLNYVQRYLHLRERTLVLAASFNFNKEIIETRTSSCSL
ncbi:hypothetical protein Droror1_Dr00016028 [Drosera rotundifolia]